MRTWIVLLLLAGSVCLLSEQAVGARWQNLIDRADSLITAGNLDEVGLDKETGELNLDKGTSANLIS